MPMSNQIEIPSFFPSPGDVAGRRVVLTGAGRGLGELLAHAFSHAGASVALVARTEGDISAVAAELPGPSLVFSGDVRDEAFNESVADATVAEWGGLDAWSCNAGISPIVAGPLETEPSVWRDVIVLASRQREILTRRIGYPAAKVHQFEEWLDAGVKQGPQVRR